MNASIAQVDEVHLPQVRSLRHGAEIRRALRSPVEHHQREDLRLPLVLVRHPCHHHWHSGELLQLRLVDTKSIQCFPPIW